ncbi:STING domain-containing protein [Flavitalea sp.]|nr:STING domain-containing protein [Flavitalea sp.]
MNPKEIIKRCFVIGPMRDIDRLRRLANEIILPIVSPEGFKVITPEEGEIGTIMHQILLNLEQADFLVADISNNNPNVMYELGVYHSFGKPYIVLKDTSIDNEGTKTPFDVAAFRYSLIDTNKAGEAIAILKPNIVNLIRKINVLDWFPNPVTSFYMSPVAEIPTAVGLSKNYLKNFLSIVLPKVFLRNEIGSGYELDVKVQNGNHLSEFETVPLTLRDKLKFEVLIPSKMHMADHDYIRNLKESGILKYNNAKVFRRSRDFNVHFRHDEEGNLVLADIPTVLSTLNESISKRRGNQATQVNDEDWNLLEYQELERFATKCEIFKKDLIKKYPGIIGRIDIKWGWDI